MKKILPDLIAILVFAVISFVYFFPAVTEDRILFQNDSVAGAGAGQEAKEYYERTGERSRWTNSIFGGMPTYQISPSYDSTDSLKVVEKTYHLFLPPYVWLVFVMMLGFYILLRAFELKPIISAAGAIAWGFSSYFLILIAAGHIWKFVTLAYIPPTIAGIVLAYRGKYLAGGLLAALFVALQILSNHVQMSYYFLFVILAIAIAYFFQLKQEGKLVQFWKASGVLVVAALIGVAINASNLYHTYKYSKETMRSKSELVYEGDKANQTSSGLDRDYITQWSNGIGETFSLLVPNVKGGVSAPLSLNPKAMEKANPMYAGLYSQLTQYWGDQPIMSGPVYVGALVMLLFILGCFIVKGPVKWALLAVTILSIMLGWGKNFMPLTDFFIDFVPMYNKFRAVSSILVIAQFTIPLLGILALNKLLHHPERIMTEWKKPVWISFGLTAGIALLFALFPKMFFSSYIPPMEMSALQDWGTRSGLASQQMAVLFDNLETMRVSLFTSDAWRSFFIIALGMALIVLCARKLIKPVWMVAGVAVICLVDLWQVDKRYLHDSLFQPKSIQTSTFRKTPTDEFLLSDEDPNFRVLNMATSTFQENNTSYWHKSVGGYHAAKLRRYQEMIEHYISPQMQLGTRAIAEVGGDMEQVDPNIFPVLNMLNTKYFILPTGQGNTVPIENPYTFGNAWFVNQVQYVDNANEEMDTLGEVDLLETAVVDRKFAQALNNMTETKTDSLATIELQSYEPNHLVYKSQSTEEGVVVFSEIYYPDWEVTIDGQPARLARANYILRTLVVPAGEHTIEMKFTPQSIRTTETIAYIALVLLAMGAIVYIYLCGKAKRSSRS
ncbi:YfhO family protein [Bacteroides sp. OttesenSCG-928-E20]|nr:YfhO family protein [Bacteroides sp. OttesenSCG-928-N06]MDL2299875.1 YfhO family protein [Bacteroides sp. OttesenSCG-928-E20]MDL2306165.1 YfhO family protein [Bacteroides sp. OttesenSCG-928-D19]